MSDPDDWLRRALGARGVEQPCERCSGLGRYHYAHGSTWRGGMGVCAFTWDVCDQCWGSGDANRPGADLRELEAARKAWDESQVLEYLGKRLGTYLPSIRKRLRRLAELSARESRRRKLPAGEDAFRWARDFEAFESILTKLADGADEKYRDHPVWGGKR